MYAPPNELKQAAEVLGRLAEVAKGLLDLSSKSNDSATVATLMRHARGVIDITEELNGIVARIAAANTDFGQG
jgi:hypothetical protein